MALILLTIKHPHSTIAYRSPPNRTKPCSRMNVVSLKSISAEISPSSCKNNNYQSIDVSDTLRPLASRKSRQQEDPRHIVLSRDTSVVLELDFAPDSGRELPFDALKIPFTRSVNHPGDQTGRKPLSFEILLVDVLADTFVPVDEWVQRYDGDTWPSPVDFQAEEGIIDLRDGKAAIRFKIPCCLLDSMARTGSFR